MKNFTKIVFVLILSLVASGLKAQSYGYYYSGSVHTSQRQVPHAIVRVVNLYPGFVWMGTTQVQRGHRQLYIVTLRRDNRFIELTINRHGDIISKSRYVRTYNVYTKPYRRRPGRAILFHDPGYVYSRIDDQRFDNNYWQQDWDHGKKAKNGQKWTKQDDDRRGHPRR